MSERVLQALLRHTNQHGLVIAREGGLLEELGITSDALRSALRELESARAIEVIAPPPFLVLRLKKWPGSDEKAANSAANAYSYSKRLNNKAITADSYRPEEVAENDGLLHEILETLGETDPESFRKAIEHYSPAAIRTALERVRRAKSIRKSRTALFRHLLPRIAKDSEQIS